MPFDNYVKEISDKSGFYPESLDALKGELLKVAQKLAHGLTTELPATLIEDIVSTQMAGLLQLSQTRTEAAESYNPLLMSPMFLADYGRLLGIEQAAAVNGSVLLDFRGTPNGFVPAGLQVTDGQQVWVVENYFSLDSDGKAASVFASASTFSTLSAAPHTVNQINSSFPAALNLSVTNPTSSTPCVQAQTADEFRQRCWDKMQSTAQGSFTAIKSALKSVEGVVVRSVAARQTPDNRIQVLVDGGRPEAVGAAIYNSLLTINQVVGLPDGDPRNVTISIRDFPDTYTLTYIKPARLPVTLKVNYGTTLVNVIDNNKLQETIAPVLSDYINGLYSGEVISVAKMKSLFEGQFELVASLDYLRLLDIQVFINGQQYTPKGDDLLIVYDENSYLTCSSDAVSVNLNA